MIGAAPTVLGAAAWRFASPGVLLLLLALPVVALLLWVAFARARRALVVFAGTTPQPTRPAPARAVMKLCLIVAGTGSLVLALARPQADPVEESVTVRGRDVVFIVDVSRSMLSRDAVPNRLSRAKLWINDLVNTLRGDRVGLVAFAGAAVVKSPLTMDYGFFRMELDELSPASVPRGGTMIGDAIRKAMNDVFEPGPGRYRDIVLITDGEDQGSFPTEAAKQAAEQGVRLIVVGIGSELEGAPVPAEERADQKFVEYHGERVRSRLDQTTLAAIADAASRAAGESGGGGVFLNVGTGTVDLDKVYHDLVGSADQRETETKSNVLYRELFPYFLLIGGACLAIEPLIAGRVRNRTAPTRAANGVTGAALAAAAMAASLIGHGARAGEAPPTAPGQVSAAPAVPERPDTLYNTGRELFAAGKFAEAAQRFRDADSQTTDAELSARARFNLGQALLKEASPPNGAPSSAKPEETKARLEAAARAFRSALESKPGDAEAARNVEIARRMLKDFEEQQEKQKQQSKDQQSKNGESKDQNQDRNKDQEKQDQQKQDQQNKTGKQDGKDQSGQQSGDAGEQNQQNAEKLKDLAEQQKNAADQTKKAGEQQEAQKQSDERKKAERDQQAVSEKTEQQQKESAKSAGDGAKQKLDAARKEQQAAQDAMKQGDDEKAEQHQRKASDMLNEAAQAEQQQADRAREQQAKEDKAKQGDPKDPGKDAQKQEPKYDQTASQLLDKERKERDARQQMLRALRGRPVPVEKDW